MKQVILHLTDGMDHHARVCKKNKVLKCTCGRHSQANIFQYTCATRWFAYCEMHIKGHHNINHYYLK